MLYVLDLLDGLIVGLLSRGAIGTPLSSLASPQIDGLTDALMFLAERP